MLAGRKALLRATVPLALSSPSLLSWLKERGTPVLNLPSLDDKTARLFLLRHGEVEEAYQGIYYGQGDPGLSPAGFGHIERAAKLLGGQEISALYSSGLQRSHQGALLVAERLGFQGKVVKLDGLREIHFGRWQGLRFEEVAQKFPEDWEARFQDIVHFRIPGGETLVELSARVLGTVREIVERHRGEAVAVVAHAGPIRAILCDTLDIPLTHVFRIDQHYGALNVIDFMPDTPTVRLVNG